MAAFLTVRFLAVRAVDLRAEVAREAFFFTVALAGAVVWSGVEVPTAGAGLAGAGVVSAKAPGKLPTPSAAVRRMAETIERLGEIVFFIYLLSSKILHLHLDFHAPNGRAAK